MDEDISFSNSRTTMDIFCTKNVILLGGNWHIILFSCFDYYTNGIHLINLPHL